jgi:hypothetical protein
MTSIKRLLWIIISTFAGAAYFILLYQISFRWPVTSCIDRCPVGSWCGTCMNSWSNIWINLMILAGSSVVLIVIIVMMVKGIQKKKRIVGSRPKT